MTVKKTWEEISFFLMMAAGWLQSNKKNPDTKLAYAITRVTKSLMRSRKKRTQMIEDIEVELAIEENGKLLRNGQGVLEFSRENELQRLKRIREIDDKLFEFETYFATSLPKDLTDEERDAFEGFVIAPQQADAKSNGGESASAKVKKEKAQ